jgi:RimJ/RimL family protein N-acetyltransferase
MLQEQIIVRQFIPHEWQIYKQIRLKALQTDPSVFGSTYDETITQPDIYWRERLENPDNGIFGIFHGEILIGMTGIYIEDKASGEAWLGSSWLEKEWRNKGLSKKLFDARLKWARQHSALKDLLVAHKEHNISSRQAILKQGFQFDRLDNIQSELVYKMELGA